MVEHTAVNRGVVGSSPTRGVDSKLSGVARPQEMRLHGQAVKTSPFHGGNTGSIPVGVTCVNCFIINQMGFVPTFPIRVYGPLAQLVRATGS